MKKHPIPDFTIYLKEYLERNYPEKATDSQFVEQRNRLAQQTYSDNMAQHSNHDLSMERAMGTLLKDYMFSKFDAVFDAVCDDSTNALSPDEAVVYVNSLMRDCETVFRRHIIRDDLLCGEEYLQLKQELKNLIASKDKVEKA